MHKIVQIYSILRLFRAKLGFFKQIRGLLPLLAFLARRDGGAEENHVRLDPNPCQIVEERDGTPPIATPFVMAEASCEFLGIA